jgi:hypothetical protein
MRPASRRRCEEDETPLIMSIRVGKRADPVHRHVNLVLRCLLRDVQNKVEKEMREKAERNLRAAVVASVESLVQMVVEKVNKPSIAPAISYFSGFLGLALVEDHGLDYVYCKPLQSSKLKSLPKKAPPLPISPFQLPFGRPSKPLQEGPWELVAVPQPCHEWVAFTAKPQELKRSASMKRGLPPPTLSANATLHDPSAHIQLRPPPVRVPGWAARSTDVILLQKVVRGHCARTKVRKAVRALAEPIYTVRFDLECGMSYFVCSMNDRVSWARPQLLFPKRKRNLDYYVLYLQTRARKRLAKMRAGDAAVHVYVRILVPSPIKPKKSKPSGHEESARPAFCYYNTRTGVTSRDPPTLLYHHTVDELSLQLTANVPEASDLGLSVGGGSPKSPDRNGNGNGSARSLSELNGEEGTLDSGSAPESSPSKPRLELSLVESVGSGSEAAGGSGESSLSLPAKKKPLTKLEKAQKKEEARHRAATAIQAKYRSWVGRREVGRLLLREKRYARVLDGKFRRHYYVHQGGRVTWVKPAPLWGLHDADFDAPPAKKALTVTFTAAPFFGGLGSALSQLGKGFWSTAAVAHRSAKVAPEKEASPMKLYVRDLRSPLAPSPEVKKIEAEPDDSGW